MSVGQAISRMSDRFYDRMRDPAARAAAAGEAPAADFEGLRGCKYCLLISYRRSGEPVPTPVWFGLGADGRAYVQTDAGSGKVKRIRANPRVRVAPANARGKPLGPAAEATARILEPAEHAGAERALRSNYGLGRRLYEATFGRTGSTSAYIEITPPDVGPPDQPTETGAA
jgi:PPOX class probable F420-dependent enzyme